MDLFQDNSVQSFCTNSSHKPRLSLSACRSCVSSHPSICFFCRNRYTIFFGLTARIKFSISAFFCRQKAATNKQDLLHTEFYSGPQSKTSARNGIRMVQRRIQSPDMIMPTLTMPRAQAEMGEAAAHTTNPTATSFASAGRVASPVERSVDHLSAKHEAGEPTTGECNTGRYAAGENPAGSTRERAAGERVAASCAAAPCRGFLRCGFDARPGNARAVGNASRLLRPPFHLAPRNLDLNSSTCPLSAQPLVAPSNDDWPTQTGQRALLQQKCWFKFFKQGEGRRPNQLG